LKGTRKVAKNLGGRPTRAQRSAKALAELGVDPSSIDPRKILASIAIDTTAPAAARVQACRLLMAGASGPQPTREENAMALLDKRTMEILNRRVN
jgi:hypothetical protein